VEVEQIDLSLKASIADFAERILAKYAFIDVLVNSAATYGTFMTGDNFVAGMEINLLGPALLTDLLLPVLRGGGRVVNVAAAAYDPPFLTANTTVEELSAITRSLDAGLNATGGYYGLSKFLMVHHAIELAEREPTVSAVSLAPGVALDLPNFPTWLKHGVMHFKYPEWLLKRLPEDFAHFVRACTTNEIDLASCPETLAQGAGVVAAISAWPEVQEYSGSYFDFDSKPLPMDAPHEYGRWVQADPTCVPRQPDAMDSTLRAAWYDEMLRLMRRDSEVVLEAASALVV
jgi:NAD(P)-dependent dehydrogenase (short-subunit alcohol dehydrogenase family)